MTGEPLHEILSRPAPEAVEGFMARWHPDAGGGIEAPAFLPGALRRFYERHGAAASAFAFNRLLAADDVGEDDGFLVFCVEEQAVYLWGVATADLGEDDPPVWCRENDPGRPWVQHAPSVSVFLVQMLVMSAAMSEPHCALASWLTPEQTERVLAPLRVLDLPPWDWPAGPDTRWYAGEDAVAFAVANLARPDDPVEYLSVYVGGLSEESIAFLEPHMSDAWDYYSPRDE